MMKQQALSLAKQNHCQKCYKAISPDLAEKSKQRCDGQVLCFSHQMFYTSQKLRHRRLARQYATKHTPRTQSPTPVA